MLFVMHFRISHLYIVDIMGSLRYARLGVWRGQYRSNRMSLPMISLSKYILRCKVFVMKIAQKAAL